MVGWVGLVSMSFYRVIRAMHAYMPLKGCRGDLFVYSVYLFINRYMLNKGGDRGFSFYISCKFTFYDHKWTIEKSLILSQYQGF